MTLNPCEFTEQNDDEPYGIYQTLRDGIAFSVFMCAMIFVISFANIATMTDAQFENLINPYSQTLTGNGNPHKSNPAFVRSVRNGTHPLAVSDAEYYSYRNSNGR